MQYEVIYGHLSIFLVQAGSQSGLYSGQVEEGQVIGMTGNTGNSSGPHLHFELRTSAASVLSCFDPLPLLDKTEQPNRQPLFYAVINCDALNIRKDPSRDHAASGILKMGDVIPIYDIQGPAVWVEHDRGFSAWCMDGENYMKPKDS